MYMRTEGRRLLRSVLTPHRIKYIRRSQYVTLAVTPNLIITRFYDFAGVTNSNNELAIPPLAFKNERVDTSTSFPTLLIKM
jgi:hypothetical protein